VEKEYAWTELQHYLPLNHERVQSEEVREAIRRVVGDG
jgi:hypothetical protein